MSSFTPRPRRIVLATFGSLGDLHPYLAIARELQRLGHHPVIATTDWHADTVRAHGIRFTPMHPLAENLGNPRDHVARLFDPKTGPEYLVRELVMPYLRDAHRELLAATRGADVLVTHPLAMAGPLIAEQTRIAWVSTVLSPMSLLSAIDAPVFPGAPLLAWMRRLGVVPYRMMFALVKHVAARWEKPLAELRREVGLPAARPGLFEGQFSPRLNLALFSPELASPQRDWPLNTVVCGFPRFDGAPPSGATLEALEGFLASGDPPVVLTLGSSAFAIAEGFWSEALQAGERLQRRLLMITGDERVRSPWITRQVAAFEYLAYSSVFPHALATVHQGGIGTLSQALAAGRPQLVVPVAFDQPDNAARTVRLGVARTVPFALANAETLTRELQPLIDEPAYAKQASAVSARLAAEPGAERAADLISRVSREG